MTSWWARWCLKSPASRLFTPPFIQVQIKKIAKVRVTCLYTGNSPVTGESPAQRASNAENVRWRHHDRRAVIRYEGVTIVLQTYNPDGMWSYFEIWISELDIQKQFATIRHKFLQWNRFQNYARSHWGQMIQMLNFMLKTLPIHQPRKRHWFIQVWDTLYSICLKKYNAHHHPHFNKMRSERKGHHFPTTF